MSSKMVGGIIAIICMVSVVIYFILNWLIGPSYSWIVFMICGVACASISIIHGIKDEERKKQNKNK